MHLGYFTLKSNTYNNDDIEFPIQMITLIRNIENYNGVMYKELWEPNYKQISQQLTEKWQIKSFKNTNFSLSTKLLP